MWQVCLRKILPEIEMLAYDVLRRESAPDSEGCSGAQLGGHLLIPASQTFITCTVHRTLLSQARWRTQSGTTTGTAQLRMLTRAASREQWTLHLVVTLDLNTLYLQLTTDNSRKQGHGLTLTALGSKIQVIEFLGGQYKSRLVTSGNE